MLGPERRRPDADSQRVPPGAGARLQHLLGRAPADEVRRAGEEDLAAGAAELGLRAVEHHPAAVDPVRQKRGVLVLGLPDDPVALDRREVLGGGEIDRRPRGAVRRAGDRPAAELGDPDDARVLEPPLLALDVDGGREQRLGVDRPAVDAVRGARDGEVRDPPAVLDAREQNGLAVDEAAAGLKTALTGYGQSSAVRIGLPGWRVKSSAPVTPPPRRGRGSRPRRARRQRRGRVRRDGTRASTRRPRSSFTSSKPSPSLQPPVAKS